MAQQGAQPGGAPLLSVKGIRKSFSLNAVLKGIDLSVGAGEVLTLIGGNGAGKSTLMKIIMGIYQQDEGDIYIKGEKLNLSRPSVALAAGIYMVPQEPMLFPNMSVEENILIGFSEKPAELRRRLVQQMDEIGWHLDLHRKASSLSIAEQQLVEILRGLLRNAQVLILDEPTSALTFKEVESLFKCVNDLREKGIGIIYITHRLAEVFELATHVAILRDGVVTLQGPVADFTREMLVKGLLPPNMDEVEQKEGCTVTIDYKNLKPVFELQKFSGYGFSNIDLKVYPGEILGVAGVVGAGRTELATTIFGRDRALGGKAILDGKDITGLSTEKVLAAGVNYVPEDRHLHGLFKISDVAANTTSAILGRREMGRFFLNGKREREVTQKYVDDFRTKVTGQDQLVGSLSGGNQQKVVLAKWLVGDVKVMILDEPTRGIDVGAKSEIHKLMTNFAREGMGIIMISSELPEILGMSDRVVVMQEGIIQGILDRSEATQESVMKLATRGVSKK